MVGDGIRLKVTKTFQTFLSILVVCNWRTEDETAKE